LAGDCDNWLGKLPSPTHKSIQCFLTLEQLEAYLNFRLLMDAIGNNNVDSISSRTSRLT
jgi:hypothetical protein